MDKVLDLWWHPLLGEKHSPLVKAVDIITQPLEYILPGRNAPRHVKQGLCCFSLSLEGSRTMPKVWNPLVPLLQLPAVNSIFIDLPSEQLPTLMGRLNSPELRGVASRQPSRSPSSTVEASRVRVEILLPPGNSEVADVLTINLIRRSVLTDSMICGHRNLYTARDALILECCSPNAMIRAWPLCSQALFLSPDRALIYTEASQVSWMDMADNLMKEDGSNAITRVKWKPSSHGGRPWITPSATPTQIAASRRQNRRNGKSASFVDNVAEVRIEGEVGKEDAQVMHALIDHACTATGLSLTAASGNGSPGVGKWVYLASRDPTAKPGHARLFLSSQEEVRKVYAALNGQVVQVGPDHITISVSNDIQDGRGNRANGRGGLS